MQFHQIKPKTRFLHARRIGRGGKRGTTSGRGTKGMGARAGAKFRPAERELLKKIPKLRGYKFKVFRVKPAVVNLADIEAEFRAEEIVSPAALLKHGLIRKTAGRIPTVKILGKGELKKKITFQNVIFSGSAAAKIKKGGE